MMFRRTFDLFLFSSLFIALCAVLMAHQANDLLNLQYSSHLYLWFVFFSTICSYNFHWYITPHTDSENRRIFWTQRHKGLHLFLIGTGLTGAFVFFLQVSEYWVWLGIPVILTFLYSAPKLPLGFARYLKKIAIGKTAFLALVWTYVTSILPVILSHQSWNPTSVAFCAARFFLIYAICIIFDFRDRKQDRRDGIKSMITYFNEEGINYLFYSSLILYLVITFSLYYYGFSLVITIILVLPACIILALYKPAKKNFSDYLYYFILDGMMALPALLTSFLSF